MTTKKKAAKKQAKRVNVGPNGPVGHQLAQGREVVPLPEALKSFDDALEKVQDIRAVMRSIPGGLDATHDEVVANRARRMSDAASALQNAAWTLRESAYAEADK